MKKLFLLAAILSPSAAWAHSGHETYGFVAGLAHPFQGLDHLIFMVAVGLLAGCAFGKLRWQLPLFTLLALASGMLLGGVVGGSMVVEWGIVLSVCLIPLLLLRRLPFKAHLIAAFAVLHGVAHGSELVMNNGAEAFAGILLGSVLLLTIGYVLSGLAPKMSWSSLK